MTSAVILTPLQPYDPTASNAGLKMPGSKAAHLLPRGGGANPMLMWLVS